MIKKGSIYGLIAKLYLLVLGIFSAIRVIFFIRQLGHINSSNGDVLNILRGFFMGLRFDIVVSGYVLILPVLILLILDIFQMESKFVLRFFFWWIFILFSVTFFISAADIPYFDQFFAHVSMGAFEWTDSPGFVAKMIFQDPKIYLFLVLGLLVIIFFYRRLKRIFINLQTIRAQNPFLRTFFSVVVLALIFLGIRGRISAKSPIRIGTAYFCNDPFLNKLGLNANFCLIRSYLDEQKPGKKHIDFMDAQDALSLVKKYYHIEQDDDLASPLARKITPNQPATNKYNVVLIIMESMSAAKMERHGNPNRLTPFLDSLSQQSLYFDHCYSAGIHTFNGLFSTLVSLPALYRKHPLQEMKSFDGIATTLRQKGYSTTFFSTHDTQFDNMEAFFLTNGFERVYSQKDYPAKEVVSSLGVPDDYLFRFALPVLDELNQQKQPFFTAFMTASDHTPYVVPEYFKPHNTNKKLQITEFADWSLKQFFAQAQTKPWFDNTIFVLLGDHGVPTNVKYDVSLNYHHIPLVIYAPNIVKPDVNRNIAGQIDCFPTIMGVLEQPYINSTLGIDLQKEKRSYIFINGDDKLAVLDTSFLLIYDGEKSIKLHKYKDLDQTNYADDFPEKVADMLQYMKANLQTYEYVDGLK